MSETAETRGELVQQEEIKVPAVSVQAPSDIMQIIGQMAMNPQADVDKMDRLLQMKERIDANEAKREYSMAMVRAQKKMPSIQATSNNTQTNSKFAKLEKINEAITPIYTAEGFSLSFGEEGCPHEGWFRTVCHVNHRGGHSEVFYYDLPLDKAGIAGKVNKTDIHAKASSTTYARRYLTCLIFNLAVGEDMDGNEQGAVSGDTITEEQFKQIMDLCSATRMATAAFAKSFGIESMKELPASQFQKAMNILNARQKNR